MSKFSMGGTNLMRENITIGLLEVTDCENSSLTRS